MATLQTPFAQRLKRLAAERQVNQSDVARACGVTPQSAQRWFAGVSLPRPQYLGTVARVLGVTPEELAAGIQELDGVLAELRGETPARPGEPGREALSPTSRIVMNFYQAQQRANEAKQQALRTQIQAETVALDTLYEMLSWQGYEPIEDARPGSDQLLVQGVDGNPFLITLRLTGPHPIDIAPRRSGAATDVQHLLVYAFLCLPDGHLHFLLLPCPSPGNGLSSEACRDLLQLAAQWLAECSLVPFKQRHVLRRAEGDSRPVETPAELEPFIDNFNLSKLVG